jgi:hypothetical protein
MDGSDTGGCLLLWSRSLWSVQRDGLERKVDVGGPSHAGNLGKH